MAGGTANQLGYDVSNRMVGSNGSSLQGSNEYDSSNRRVYQLKQHFDGNGWVTDATEYYFYGIPGQKLGTYFAAVSGSGAGTTMSWSLSQTQVFFGRKLISRSISVAQEDIRGSVGSYYPYGEDRTSTANDAIKFATYVRDSVSGLDYADQRSHVPGVGRFTTTDPYQAGGGAGSPGSWNRYAYVEGDPIDFNDARGTSRCSVVSVQTTYPDPENALSPISRAEVWCQSTGNTVVANFWIENYNGDYKSTAKDSEAGVGAGLDKIEQDGMLTNAISEAMITLSTNSKCAGVFGSPTVLGSFGLTAQGVLGSLQASGSYRFSQSNAFPFIMGGITTYSQTVILGVRVSWSASITLDKNLVTDPTELFLTVIHELGHVLWGLGFRGEFRDDDSFSNPANQDFNDRLIKRLCL